MSGLNTSSGLAGGVGTSGTRVCVRVTVGGTTGALGNGAVLPAGGAVVAGGVRAAVAVAAVCPTAACPHALRLPSARLRPSAVPVARRARCNKCNKGRLSLVGGLMGGCSGSRHMR